MGVGHGNPQGVLRVRTRDKHKARRRSGVPGRSQDYLSETTANWQDGYRPQNAQAYMQAVVGRY
ncbi:hypothetical protein N7453_001987 [Penicillium expansum]|nr:hypothetical protein N7453_001987 [Penicillium expansum]